MNDRSPRRDGNAALPYAPDQVPTGMRRELLDRAGVAGPALDIGCWSGFAGRSLQERGITVDGVEPDPEMAALAARSYRDVWVTSIEKALPKLISQHGGAYVTILFLDVLEHLAKPELVLESAHELVAPDGRALVSLPNIAHWRMRAHLLRGRWRYQRSGLLDETHLRFFTFHSGRALLESTGWEVMWQAAEVDEPRLARVLPKGMRSTPPWLNLVGVQALFEARSMRVQSRTER